MRVWVAIAAGMGLLAGTVAAQDRPRLRPIPKNDTGMKTGPAAGERIPAFAAPDQNGKKQTFGTLKGDKGLMLLFVRSADW